MTRSFSCPHASEITRRDGPDIACGSPNCNALCQGFYQELRVQALAALGQVDDLTQLPSSVLQKMQFGGLMGLQECVQGKSTESINDIAALLASAKLHFGELKNFPYPVCVAAVESYQLKRRRGR